MKNAKKEFLQLMEMFPVIAATVTIVNGYDDEATVVKAKLKVGYTPEDLTSFLNEIDVEYDAGYGGQELFGTVWGDGEWVTRWEYDGSEGWDIHKYPPIPEELV